MNAEDVAEFLQQRGRLIGGAYPSQALAVFNLIAERDELRAALDALSQKPASNDAEKRGMVDKAAAWDGARASFAKGRRAGLQDASAQSSGVTDEIAAERRRQIEVEGFTAEHDDRNWTHQLSEAAACYAGHAALGLKGKQTHSIPAFWPWHDDWWRPTTPRRDLIKAGALIVAEIERLDRAATDG